jgi:hypothetical protein
VITWYVFYGICLEDPRKSTKQARLFRGQMLNRGPPEYGGRRDNHSTAASGTGNGGIHDAIRRCAKKPVFITGKSLILYHVHVVHVDGVRLCLLTAAIIGSFVHPPDVYIDSHGGMIDRVNQNNSERNLSKCNSVHYKSHWPERERGPPSWEAGD